MSVDLDLDVVKLVDEKLLTKHRILPLLQRGKRLYIAVCDPTNLQALDDIKFQTTLRIEAVVVAEPARVVFQRDLNGNGLIDPTSERVTYLLRAGETTLRRDAGGGAQPIAEGIRRFALLYLDKDGAPTIEPAQVGFIRIEIEAGRHGPEATMATQVMLRNATIW